MDNIMTAISAGFTAFTATNLDDIVILLLLFSQVNTFFRRRHIVTGQYLGFAALVMVSLPGFFGSLLLPRPWIGLLGIVPIAIGISRLLTLEDDETPDSTQPGDLQSTWFSSLLSPQAYGVAAVTFANGGDNVGIYVPLFASVTWNSLLIILTLFFSLVGVWCLIAYRLTQVPAIAHTLTRYGNNLVPFVLLGLGVLILVDSHTLENRGLTAIALVVIGLFVIHLLRNLGRTITVIPDAERG